MKKKHTKVVLYCCVAVLREVVGGTVMYVGREGKGGMGRRGGDVIPRQGCSVGNLGYRSSMAPEQNKKKKEKD